MTESLTPAEFIEARLAEEEAAAAAVTSWGDPQSSDPVFVHIGLHSPEQVLRSCAAQRSAVAVGGTSVAVALAASWSTHPDYDAAWIA